MRRRLIASYLALTLIVLGSLEIPLAVTYSDRQHERLQNSLLRDAFTMAAYVEDSLEGTGGLDLQALADSYQSRTGARVVIVDGTGLVEADSSPPDAATEPSPRSFADRPEVAAALDQRITTGTRSSDTLGTDLLYVAVPVSSGGKVHGAIRLTYSTAQVQDRVHTYWLLLGGIAAVSLLAAAGVGALLARWTTRPIEDIRAAAATFGAGDLGARAPTGTGPPELRALARAFNATATRLQELITAQDHFVADASHQLRTPLTALRLRLEMLETEVDDAAAGDLDGARLEVQRLSRLVDGLLALARADRDTAAATALDLPLDEVLTERRVAWEPVADERRVRLEAHGAGARALATPDHLVQALDNLLANALDAAPADSTVELRATPSARSAEGGAPAIEIHVIDRGPGMSPEQRERAFDRFWRAGGRQNDDRRALGGSGLGLPIVQKLVRADGGTVELRETRGGGTDAVIVLPTPTVERAPIPD